MTYIAVLLFSVTVSKAEAATPSRYLNEVTVTARRPMKDIGVTKTVFDSTMLKENVANSMADVLAYNSSIFVKSYGRATLSTVAFRGTSPSHTQVTWNGMKINSPMLGMTDFSTIPSYFVDDASLLHGSSSLNEAGGGLGGLVKLATIPDMADGFNARYIQGIGSFKTFDEFLRLTYGSERWHLSTRVAYSSSPNDYKYVNHDKKLNIYDDNHNIIGQYYPTERNRSGAYKDLNILQEVYFSPSSREQLSLSAWYTHSNRELPLLTTDYGDEKEFENRQRENTFRGVISWRHTRSKWSSTINGGYIHTWMAYDYRRDVGNGELASMTRSRSLVNTVYGQANADFSPSRKWFFTAGLSAHQHFVRSIDKNIITTDGDNALLGYDKARIELSGSASAKWQPNDRFGVSVLFLEDMYGTRWSPVIPALFVDGIITRTGNISFRASVSRNHKFPSLNDLYFLPGGNPNLRSEDGVNYDIGLSFDTGSGGAWGLSGGVTWFDSYINNWIIWLPTTKGFFSPRNIRQVHAYGVEVKANLTAQLWKGWLFDLNASYSHTPSINRGDPMSPADRSVGKQLPYVPLNTASFTGRLSWRGWSFLYKWCWYSRRYTMSSNDVAISGYLPDYFMNNISLEKGLSLRPLDLSLKFAVNNLFDEDYLSVLAHPMPGINFEFFIGITPKFHHKKTSELNY